MKITFLIICCIMLVGCASDRPVKAQQNLKNNSGEETPADFGIEVQKIPPLIDNSAEELVQAYEQDPLGGLGQARALCYHFWKRNTAAVSFMEHPRHSELLVEFLEHLQNNWHLDSVLAERLYHHLVVSIANLLEQSKFGEAHLLLPLFHKTAMLCIENLIRPRVINKANYNQLSAMFSFYIKNPPGSLHSSQGEKGPAILKLLNLYIPELQIDGETGAITKSFTDEFIRRRIRDTLVETRVAEVYYYYLSDGRIMPRYYFEVLDAAATRLNSVGTAIDIYSIRPYPAELLYSRYGEYDGLVWWFPEFEGVLYLSGLRTVRFVPGFLDSHNFLMSSIMPTGAGYSVLIHELFHNVGRMFGIDAGHIYTKENRNNWPDWY